MMTAKLDKVVFSRILEGEDLFESIRRTAESNMIHAGFFIVIGSLKRATLGYYKEGKYDTIQLEGPLEIASCTGNIVVDDKKEVAVHAHIVVSDEKCRAFGGHLMKGSQVGATAELTMVEATGMNIQRVYDEKTKLKLWKLS